MAQAAAASSPFLAAAALLQQKQTIAMLMAAAQAQQQQQQAMAAAPSMYVQASGVHQPSNATAAAALASMLPSLNWPLSVTSAAAGATNTAAAAAGLKRKASYDQDADLVGVSPLLSGSVCRLYFFVGLFNRFLNAFLSRLRFNSMKLCFLVFYWVFRQLIDWLIDSLIHWFDWVIHWFDCLIDWLTGRCFGWLIVRSIDWLIDWLIDWFWKQERLIIFQEIRRIFCAWRLV